MGWCNAKKRDVVKRTGNAGDAKLVETRFIASCTYPFCAFCKFIQIQLKIFGGWVEPLQNPSQENYSCRRAITQCITLISLTIRSSSVERGVCSRTACNVGVKLWEFVAISNNRAVCSCSIWL